MTPSEFRAKHAANPEPCCDECPGWCLSEGGDGESRIERCDGCWSGYDDSVTDDDAAALPEAKWLSGAAGLEAAS
ncbi:MAG TPA: hypothetical protein VJN18_32170 [Polyangiaceae bacterium]|nr:hypothetical protein [Polyangiaceae bacterium]